VRERRRSGGHHQRRDGWNGGRPVTTAERRACRGLPGFDLASLCRGSGCRSVETSGSAETRMTNVAQGLAAMGLTAGPAMPRGVGSALEFLLPSLGRLDQLLDWATHSMHLRRPETAAPFRGLYVSREDVAHGLAQAPGASPFAPDMGVLGDEF